MYHGERRFRRPGPSGPSGGPGFRRLGRATWNARRRPVVTAADNVPAAAPVPPAQAPAPPPPPRPPWTTVLPFVVGLACFVVLAAINQLRGFELWRNYALSGDLLGGVSTYLIWRKDLRIPHYIQWVIVAGLLLHYGG